MYRNDVPYKSALIIIFNLIIAQQLIKCVAVDLIKCFEFA